MHMKSSISPHLFMYDLESYLVGGFNPFAKISQSGSFPKVGGEHKQSLQPSPSHKFDNTFPN